MKAQVHVTPKKINFLHVVFTKYIEVQGLTAIFNLLKAKSLEYRYYWVLKITFDFKVLHHDFKNFTLIKINISLCTDLTSTDLFFCFYPNAYLSKL